MLRFFRLCGISTAILIDLVVLATLRESPHLRGEVVEWFALINIPLLSFDLLLNLFFLKRRHRYYQQLHTLSLLIECATTMVWVQVTGSLSSYFLILCFFLIGIFRAFVDYRSGLVTALTMFALHLGAFSLEELGVLDRAALFEAGPGAIYSAVEYRTVAVLSISWCYAMFLGGVNLIVYRLRTTQARLRRAEQDLVRVARGVAHGRLSGSILDDRYELDELIGRGGMGEVYFARRLDDGRECAVKVLHPHLTEDPESLARFEHEALAVARLPERFVPEILEIHIGAPECFLAMEYLRGEDLAARLRRRGKLAPAEVSALLDALAEAVEAAHAADVIHRDLKPRNVFLVRGDTKAFQIRLLDFGISKLLDQESSLTVTSALLGSPGFMSPEQARGDSRAVGPAADVFSLGAITYQALTGERPFPVRQLTLALHALVHHEPEAPSHIVPTIHPDVDAVMRIALAKEPAARYQRPKELAADLALAITGTLPETTRQRAKALDKSPDATTATKTSRGRC